MPIFGDFGRLFGEGLSEGLPADFSLRPSPSPPLVSSIARKSALSVGGWLKEFFHQKSFELAMVGISLLTLGWFYRSLDRDRAAKDAAKKQADEVIRTVTARQRRTAAPVLTYYEQLVAMDIVLPERMDVTLEDIGGLEDVKERLYETLILPLKQPHLFQRGRLLTTPRGILLYGPPGTGKTMLAKAVAKTSEAAFINVNFATVMNKWMGESEKFVQAIFSLAEKVEPCIVFIDEIDCMFRKRSDEDHELTSRVKAGFMTLWDGLNTNPNARITIIGATNRPATLDDAIQRRMPQSFHIGLPEFKQRVSILKIILKGEPVEDGFDIEALARETDGYSGSDLHALAQAAARFAIRDYVRSQGSHQQQQQHPSPGDDQPSPPPVSLRPITLDDFLEAKSIVAATGVAASSYAQRQQARRPLPEETSLGDVLGSLLRPQTGSTNFASPSSGGGGATPINFNVFLGGQPPSSPHAPFDRQD